MYRNHMQPTVSKRTQSIVTLVLILILVSIIGVYIYLGMRQVEDMPAEVDQMEVESVDSAPETSPLDIDQAILEAQARGESTSILSEEEKTAIMMQLEASVAAEAETTNSDPGLTPAERTEIMENLIQAEEPPIEVVE